MSDIIHLLPDSVANQIAAGEVIQRPASIIKELVENSLDAGAKSIDVIVEDAGKSLVQVIDNGHGMSDTDARLSFERHATSKIKQATDLFALSTMGFRGEALASIAAVAQVELRTRSEGANVGTAIRIEGSKVVSQEVISCPVGANFAVRNLFFNIPARRKFLKSNQTELTNILTEFERIALARPDITFTLRSGENLILDLPEGNFRKRIVSIFGHRIDTHLIPVDTDTTLVHIHGFIGMPDAARRKGAQQYFFVNGRFMRHPYFAKAIQTAYERLLPEGKQIPFFLNFEVDPARIDVNIHPTKTEIKFEDDNAIFQILLAAVRESLGKFGAVPAIDFDNEGSPEIPPFVDPAFADHTIAPPQIHLNPNFNPFSPTPKNEKPSERRAAATIDWRKVFEESQNHNAQSVEGTYQKPEFSAPEFPDFTPSFHIKEEETTLFSDLPLDERPDLVTASPDDYLQYLGRYIVTPFGGGLTLIDQHRAHVRILYEQYIQQNKSESIPSQRLLFPEMMQTSPSEAVVMDTIIPRLHEVGFDISPLGGGSFSILAVPISTEGIPPVSLVSTILNDAIEGQANAAETVGHIIALSIARKVAIPVGQVLTKDEMILLTRQLFSTTTPGLTPDGKQILLTFSPENEF